ncbi:MAG: HD domain-containing protein [Burkholderiales bacterium]|nr:HD domain-containing protein [Burkholderiales bacterium]
MFTHQDHLGGIHQDIPLAEKIDSIYAILKERLPFLSRVSLALYDARSDILRTFMHFSAEANPLVNYQARLAEAPSLAEIVRKGRPRVVNDLVLFASGEHEHTRRMEEEGHSSSYTMPVYVRGAFFGFIFFNSREPSSFTEDVLSQIDPFGHLIAMAIISELSVVQTLLATIKTARDMAHLRDDETGAHQDRMSRFARLIARKLANEHGFSDEYIENVFIFAPLHDIGKLGVPDQILLKPGRLTEDEYVQMKAHTIKGRQIIDRMVENFELDQVSHLDIMRNIAEFHHEAMDGSGYPEGRKGDEIPIEARIIAVADIFDALTSRRPYKEPWSMDEAFSMLVQLSGTKLDAACVKVFLESRDEIEEIRQQFEEKSPDEASEKTSFDLRPAMSQA